LTSQDSGAGKSVANKADAKKRPAPGAINLKAELITSLLDRMETDRWGALEMRELLAWGGARRPSARVIRQVSEALEQLGLDSGGFKAAGIRDTVVFAKAGYDERMVSWATSTARAALRFSPHHFTRPGERLNLTPVRYVSHWHLKGWPHGHEAFLGEDLLALRASLDDKETVVIKHDQLRKLVLRDLNAPPYNSAWRWEDSQKQTYERTLQELSIETLPGLAWNAKSREVTLRREGVLLDAIHEGTGIPRVRIREVARRADHLYKEFAIAKHNGEKREVHHPVWALKWIQRWLADAIMSQWPVHDAAFAYRSGRSIRDNAARHAGNHYLLSLDLKGFFPSIRFGDVLRYLKSTPPGTERWTDFDRRLFCRIACRHGGLTIGAPSSPVLSNALCHELDEQLSRLADESGLTYSRYADDLFFSTRQPDLLREVPARVSGVLKGLVVTKHLYLNSSKTRHMSRRGRRRVTGLILTTSGDLSIGRARKRQIRSLVHRHDDLDADERLRLAGLLAFGASIEDGLIQSLTRKYGAARIEAARKGSVEP
jgi:RNA-directed DNA polymerase